MISQRDVQEIISSLCGGISQIFPQDKLEAILFGSYARGEAGDDSDIDVLILVDASRQRIADKNWQIGCLRRSF